ncbi:hypothetical protein BVX94_01285 [bacterium B17]|nr:hypothetical protein BVX94_01285 [bacterium B17]
MKKSMLIITLCTIIAAGCGAPKEETTKSDLLKPELLFTLADQYDSPDGMTIGKDGNIYLAMNCAGKDFKFANHAKIMRITADDKLEEVGTLPPHPETKVASPLGIVFGPDGSLYICDNQAFAGGTKKSRVLRMTIEDGKAVKTEVLVEGLQMANGIAVRGGSLYVNETAIDPEAKPMISGVYRFKFSELDPANVIKVTGSDDPHLFLKVETDYPNDLMKVGANGIDFDSKGNMYVCNFGEAAVIKATFKEDGTIDKVSNLCKGQGIESSDGCHIDQNDDLWVADFMGNAIVKVCTKSGDVTIVAKNEPGDGKDGALDAPSECIRRGNKVYVSNIDITYGPNAYDELQTMSVINLE